MKSCSLVVSATFAMIASTVHAQQPVPPGCYADLNGKVSCPPLGGELHVTLSGQAVCGIGRCLRDPFGKITCSTQPGGQIIQDVSGQTRCAGGCEEASAANCQRLQ